jgi:ribosomal protein L37AE/L43A
MPWWGFGWGRYRRPVTFEEKGRKAPKNCPRCGRRMVTRTVYYECPGCGYTENAPTTRPHRDVQPVDNLQHRLEEQIEEARHADEPAEREFALAAVAPEMAREYSWLCRIGAVLALFVVGFWGLMIWTGVVADLDELFVMCWQAIMLGTAILALALFHSARFLKQLGIVVALLMIPLLVYAHALIMGTMETANQGNKLDLYDSIGQVVAVHSYIIAAVYCTWLAWYLIRERRLQGW